MSKKYDRMLETAKAYGQSRQQTGGADAAPVGQNAGSMSYEQMLSIARAYGQGQSPTTPSAAGQNVGSSARKSVESIRRSHWQKPSGTGTQSGGLPLSGAQGRFSGARAQNGLSGEQIYQARKVQEEAADEAYKSALMQFLGNAAQQAQAAATGTWQSPERQVETARRQAELAGTLREANEAGKEARKAVEWDGRQELIDEYKRLSNAGYQSPADQQRLREIRTQLEAGDLAAGNGERVYSWQHGANTFLGGTVKRIAGGVGNAAVTLGRAVGEAQARQQAWSPEAFLTAQITGEDFETRAKQIESAITSPEAEATWEKIYDTVDKWDADAAKDLQRVKEGKGVVGRAAVDIGENLLEMGFDAGVGYLTGGGSLGSMFVRTFGDAAREARQAGADQGKQILYGATKGLIEVGTEKLFDGVAGIYGVGAADEITEGLVKRLAQTDLGRTALRWLLSSVEEGGEEVISDLLDPLAKAIYQGKVDYSQLDGSEVLYDFIIGTAIGGLGGIGNFVNGENRSKNAALRAEEQIDAQIRETAREKGVELKQRDVDRIRRYMDSDMDEAEIRKARAQGKLTGTDVILGDYARAQLRERYKAEAGRDPSAALRSAQDDKGERAGEDENPTIHSVATKAAEISTESGEASAVRALNSRGEFELENGETVNIEDERVPEDLRKLARKLQELGEGTAMAFQLYEDGQNIEAFAAEWENAQKIIGERTGLSYEQAARQFHTLTEAQAREAIELGRRTARADAEFGVRNSEREEIDPSTTLRSAQDDRKRNGEGVAPYAESGRRWAPDGKAHVSYEGGTVNGVDYAPVSRKLTKAQKAQTKALEMFSQATGIGVRFYESQVNEKGEYQGENGFYDPATGSIWLDVNAGMRGVNNGRYTVICTAAHELTHHMQEAAPEQYRALQRFMLEHLNEWKGGTLDDLVRAKQARDPGLSYEDAIDEVTADGCEMMLRKTKVMQTMARENAGLFERVANWVKEWTRRIRQAFQGIDATHAEADALMDWWEDQQALWDQGIRAAVGNESGQKKTAPEGGKNGTEASRHSQTEAVKYSLREDLKVDLQAIKDRTFNFAGGELLLGTTSDFLVKEIGFSELPYYMPPTKAYRAIVTEDEARNAGQPTGGNINYHGLGVDGMYQILDRGEKPLAAFVDDEAVDGEKRDDRLVLVTDVDVNGGLGVIIVESDTTARQIGGGNTDANKTITVYDKQAAIAAVQRAFDQGRLLYIDKKSGHRFNAGRKGANCPTAIREDARRKNIQDFWANVKWRDMKKSGATSFSVDGSPSNTTMAEAFRNAKPLKSGKESVRRQQREAMPDDRELLLTAAAREGASEDLIDYRKKVRAMEANGRKLERKRAALEEMERRWNSQQTGEGDPSTALRSDQDDTGERAAEDGGQSAEERVSQEQLEELRKEVWKLDGSQRRYERDLGKMERSNSLRAELNRARAAWRDAAPQEAARAMRQMQEENESLRRYVAYYEQQMKATAPGERRVIPEDVRRVTRALLKEYGSAADPERVRGFLQALGDEIVSGRELDYKRLRQIARRAATEIVDEVMIEEDAWNGIHEPLRAAVRGKRIAMTDALRGDMTDFAYFRRTHAGTFRFVKEGGEDIDRVYQDLRGEFGEALFPESVTAPSDQLDQILEAIQITRPAQREAYVGGERSYMINAVGNDIMDRMLSGDVRESQTAADRKLQRLQEEIEELRAEASFHHADAQEARREQGKAETRARNAQKRADDRQAQQAAAWASADEYREKLLEEKRLRAQMVGQKVHELRERSIEREKTYKARERVAKAGERLSRILTENSGKKHVPDAWKQSIGGFLLSVDTMSPRAEEKARTEYAMRLMELQNLLQKAGSYDNGDFGENSPTLDLLPYLDERLQPYIDAARSKDGPVSIYSMDLSQLTDLEEIMTALTEAIRKSDTLLSDQRGQKISSLAGKTTEHLGKLDERIYSSKAGQSLRRLLAWDNATPFYAFRRFGEAGEKMFGLLSEGWSKMAMNVKKVMDFAGKTYSAEQAKAWEHEEHSFELRRRLENRLGENRDPSTQQRSAQDDSGESREAALEREDRELGEETARVTMTTAQLMGLYLSLKRSQAQGHIFGYGIRIGDYKTEKGKNVSRTENYLIDVDTAAKMVGELTEEQIRVADELQKFMQEQGSAWGNEISMARWGIRVFTEDHYYPIKSDQSNLGKAQTKDSVQGNLFRMVNQSFTKQTVKNANNAVMIESVFDVFAEHMANMAKYNALALPMLDTMRWFNDKGDPESGAVSVQKAMERAYGKDATRYVLDLMQDLNGTQEGGRGEDRFSKWTSRFKVAAISYNLRVALQQPTSIVRASMVMDPKYLVRGAAIKGGQKKAMEYSGLAVWKSMGFFDTNVARGVREQIKHTESAIDRFNEFGMKGAEFGDKVTWGAIWNACELETAEKTGLKGEALMEATAARFDQVILATQVMDSTLTRSSLMRSKSAMVKEFTGFMSEPTLTYNMLLDVASEYSAISRSQGKETARKAVAGKALRAIVVYACSAAATALAAAISDAFRDDDDYVKWTQKWWSHWKKDFGENLNPTRIVPIVADTIDALKGEQKDLMSLQWLTKLSKVYQIWKETVDIERGVSKATSITWYGNMTLWGKIYKTLDALSTVSGLGISPLARELIAVWNTVLGGLGAPKLKTYDAGPERSLQYAYADGYLSEERAREELLKQGLVKSETEADKLMYKWSLDGQGVYQAVKEAAIGNDAAAFKSAMEELVDAGYREKDARSAVRTAIKDQYQGNGQGVKLSKEQAAMYLQTYGGLDRTEANAKVQEWTCYIVTGIAYTDLREAMMSGQIDQKKAAMYLQTYGGFSSEAASDRAAYWKFCEQHPDYAEMSEEAVTRYLHEIQAGGIKAELYYNWWRDTREVKTDYDADGKPIQGKSRRDKILGYIDSLPLTTDQKDLLYYASGYKESKIGETPWH